MLLGAALGALRLSFGSQGMGCGIRPPMGFQPENQGGTVPGGRACGGIMCGGAPIMAPRSCDCT